MGGAYAPTHAERGSLTVKCRGLETIKVVLFYTKLGEGAGGFGRKLKGFSLLVLH